MSMGAASTLYYVYGLRAWEPEPGRGGATTERMKLLKWILNDVPPVVV